MRTRNLEKYSDPLENLQFCRAWREPSGLPPVKALPRSAALQRARSALAQLLTQASQSDPETAAAAIHEADRLRRRVNATWAELVCGRAT